MELNANDNGDNRRICPCCHNPLSVRTIGRHLAQRRRQFHEDLDALYEDDDDIPALGDANPGPGNDDPALGDAVPAMNELEPALGVNLDGMEGGEMEMEMENEELGLGT
jgi:hypothetical protein